MANVVERFMSKIRRDEVSDCWVWTGSKFNSGYGRFSDERRASVLAHRKSYQLFCHAIPPGIYVCHSCDNPICVNPDHLFLGTPQDNTDDKTSKNRQAKGDKIRPLKLSENDAATIKTLANRNAASISDLAKSFSVSYGVVWGIVRGHSYKWVGETK